MKGLKGGVMFGGEAPKEQYHLTTVLLSRVSPFSL